MDFKVGDRVKIKTDLIPGEKYDGVTFVNEMLPYIGSEVTIQTIQYSILSSGGIIVLAGTGWNWSQEMLEPSKFEENNLQHLLVSGKLYCPYCGEHITGEEFKPKT